MFSSLQKLYLFFSIFHFWTKNMTHPEDQKLVNQVLSVYDFILPAVSAPSAKFPYIYQRIPFLGHRHLESWGQDLLQYPVFKAFVPMIWRDNIGADPQMIDTDGVYAE